MHVISHKSQLKTCIQPFLRSKDIKCDHLCVFIPLNEYANRRNELFLVVWKIVLESKDN